MKKWLTIIMAAGLLLYPFAANAADSGSQTSQKQDAPPVAQTLVREGDFAIKLAAELDLGKPSDEATAEDILTNAGVVPVNGWISDYPMTPQIIGQLKDAVSASAASGKLHMNNEEAVKGLYSLAAQMNLPIPAGSESQAQEGSAQPPEAPSNPTVVNNYYYDQGPPIVTYYPPPYDYGYLYAWVPYPTFWFGFWFPGFYICHDFTTVVVSPIFVDRRVAVSNHVIDPVSRRVLRVDPVTRTSSGVRPVSVLRAENGRTFRNLSEMRLATNGPGWKNHDSRSSAYRNGGLTTRDSQRGAENIYRRSVERDRSAPLDRSSWRDGRPGRAGSMNGEGYRHTPPPSGRGYRDPSMREDRSTPQRMQERSYNAPMTRDNGISRSYFAPSRSDRSFNNTGQWQGGTRSLEAPRAPERTFSAPVTRGGGNRESSNSFRGNLQWR